MVENGPGCPVMRYHLIVGREVRPLRTVRSIALSSLLLLFSGQAFAQEIGDTKVEHTASPANTSLSESWKFTVRPYLFFTGVSGSVTVDPITIPINSTFSSLLDNLRLGFFISLSAEKRKWGVYTDFQYSNLFAEGTGRIPSSFELENTLGELDLTFRVPSAPTLRFLAGARIYSIKQTVTVAGEELPEASTTVFDPVIGAQGAWKLSSRWDYEMRGDIGGFGLSSEFTYQLLMLFHWELSQSVSIPFGYRILGYQIKKSSVHFNYRMTGAMLGLEFRF